MINGITPPGAPAVQPLGPASSTAAPAAPVTDVKSVSSEVASAPTLAAAIIAAAGPPIDTAKIAAIRVAIANGSYPIDPQAIASKMVDLDLPQRA